MLDRYFIRPTTVDRIRSSWIGDAIERYVSWLAEHNYAARSIFIRVPLLIRFGDSAQRAGAKTLADLPAHVEPFAHAWLRQCGEQYSDVQRRAAVRGIKGPIQQMLRLTVPKSLDSNAGVPDAFASMAPGFFVFLRRERGLRETTLVQYRHYLRRFEDYLERIDRPLLPDLPPSVITDFVTESGESIDTRSVQSLCSILKVFFRYLYRASLMTRDLSRAIESPRRYRFANLPRSISWAEVERMLQSVDRRNAIGRRDYAILLLLTTYGLRGREIAALTVDDIDWKHNRLHVGGRKAEHSTAYPLAQAAGEAIVDYLRSGRPETDERALFFEACAPHGPISRVAVTMRAKYYLRKAGIHVFRPGSHTLRHACVQRLLDAGLSFKTIGDFVGHRTPDATMIYAKVNLQGVTRGRPGRRRGGSMNSPKGPLADSIERYLAHKRSLGKQLTKVGSMLHLLDGYLLSRGVPNERQIASADLDAFIASRPRRSPRSYNGLIGAVRGLLDWMVIHEILPESPLRCESRRVTPPVRPFLFSRADAHRLLELARELPSNPRAQNRGDVYRMIFAVLYGLGLRVGEVSRLCRKDIDVDRQLLIIRHTKFGKDRLVPFGPRIGRALEEYLEREESRFGPMSPDGSVFSFDRHNRAPIGTNTISWTFHKLVPALQLTIPAGAAPPHLHCLRHSFAVSTLLRWYRTGVDPMSRLFDLSTFMGHVSPSSTAVYLTITTELLECASARFAVFAETSRKECRR